MTHWIYSVCQSLHKYEKDLLVRDSPFATVDFPRFYSLKFKLRLSADSYGDHYTKFLHGTNMNGTPYMVKGKCNDQNGQVGELPNIGVAKNLIQFRICHRKCYHFTGSILKLISFNDNILELCQ